MLTNQKQPKSTVIQWSDQQKFHFEKVKAALGKITVLLYPISYVETFLSTDASNSCIAATLYQFDPSRQLRLPLSKAQLKYAIFNKKVLAMYESVKFFRHMLDKHHFTILCDNQAVVQSLTKKNIENISAHILCQLQYISQFSIDCQFIECDKNVVDVPTCANVALIFDLPDALDFEAIVEVQKSDADIQPLCNGITSLQIKSLPI